MTTPRDEGAPEAVVEAREAYEQSIKRSDDTDAAIRRVDEIVSMMRGERTVNHWADKVRNELRKRVA